MFVCHAVCTFYALSHRPSIFLFAFFVPISPCYHFRCCYTPPSSSSRQREIDQNCSKKSGRSKLLRISSTARDSELPHIASPGVVSGSTLTVTLVIPWYPDIDLHKHFIQSHDSLSATILTSSDHATPRKGQKLLQEAKLSKRLLVENFFERVFSRSVAQQRLQAWRTYATTKIPPTTRKSSQREARCIQFRRCLEEDELSEPVLAHGHTITKQEE